MNYVFRLMIMNLCVQVDDNELFVQVDDNELCVQS